MFALYAPRTRFSRRHWTHTKTTRRQYPDVFTLSHMNSLLSDRVREFLGAKMEWEGIRSTERAVPVGSTPSEQWTSVCVAKQSRASDLTFPLSRH